MMTGYPPIPPPSQISPPPARGMGVEGAAAAGAAVTLMALAPPGEG